MSNNFAHSEGSKISNISVAKLQPFSNGKKAHIWAALAICIRTAAESGKNEVKGIRGADTVAPWSA